MSLNSIIMISTNQIKLLDHLRLTTGKIENVDS